MDQQRASYVAAKQHAGQTDKGGWAYIDHPARVAGRVAAQLGADHPAVAVAWLHDTVEDTDLSLDDLRQAGMTAEQLAALDALTHRDGETRDAYLDRVAANRWAVAVKRADLADNSDPARLAVLDAQTQRRLVAKYQRDSVTLDRLAGQHGGDDPVGSPCDLGPAPLN